jgi:hypothetical protein
MAIAGGIAETEKERPEVAPFLFEIYNPRNPRCRQITGAIFSRKLPEVVEKGYL